MKIKHFQGYGSVNAKREALYDDALVVHVWGPHEWGLELNDKYDVFNWLVRRFDKRRTDYSEIAEVTTKDYYERDSKGLDVEHCLYYIRFKPRGKGTTKNPLTSL